MDNKLERFFKKINFNIDYYKYFINAKVVKVNVNSAEKTWLIEIDIDNMIAPSIFDELSIASDSIEDVDKVYFKFNFQNDNNLFNDYFYSCFKKCSESYPILLSISEGDIVIDEYSVKINVINKVELEKINSIIPSLVITLKNLGFEGVSITAEINDEERKVFKESIKSEDVVEVPKEKVKLTNILGNEIKGKPSPVKNIIGEVNDIILECFVFGMEEKETNSGFTIYTLKISDYTDSICAKIFSKDAEVNKRITSNVKVSSWYKFRGYIKFDSFSNDLVLNVRDIEAIEKRSNKRTDDAEEKRVELHLHTIMSQMDGLIPLDKLFKKINDFGHRAVGVTDKNCIQLFPKLYKKKGDVKVLFGAEVYVVDDEVKIINKETDEDLINSTYVVFDFETTGFNAGSGDSIIEIGAVKIKNGEIIDRFDELINPGCKIRQTITDVTNITNEMLEGKDNEENAFKRFMEFYGDNPMVAHNARFDVSFIERAYREYNLGIFTNTVLDTMEISRALNPDMKHHNLTSLVKRYNVPWNEDAHHRADYDAEGTALALYKMLSTLDSSYKTIKDLNRLIDMETVYKNNKPFHLTLFAQNNDGLKNLFQVITLANTKYFYKTPRIPKSELAKYREGVLIGSGCVNGEVFSVAKRLGEDELMNTMSFYDFIEVNPPSIQDYLVETGEFTNAYEVKANLKKIIDAADKVGKMVVATGDVHTLDPDDNIYREILIHQKQPGGGFHPLYKPNLRTVPNAYLRTTKEMLDDFEFLGEDKAHEIVVTNSNKIADMIEDVVVVKPQLYPPRMENDKEIIRNMVYDNAHAMYGDELPEIIATRLDKELNGIINGGYAVMYLIAQKLVENSNENGYVVGSRGSVGSSLVATFCNITEVNPLPPHYVCPKCKKCLFELDGEALNMKYGSGFDMPDRYCECGELMHKDGQDIPFETFLGFNADKTPDIDLNFSSEYQSRAHEYTKVLFGEHNVYRAGTVSTIAEKTAFGFVQGYMEDKGITMRRPEIERLAQGITGIKRTSGQHPGGIIVIPDYMDVHDFTPFQYPAENTSAAWYTTHFEFHDIEENVLKLDILGHDDPTVLKYLCDDIQIDVNNIPLGDTSVISLFHCPDALGVTKEDIRCEMGTLGIPEFGTNFAMKMLEEIKPTTFADLIKIAGLAHGTDVWNGNARDLILDGTCQFSEVIGCRDDIMLYLIKCGIEKGQSFKISEFVRKGKTHKEPDKWVEFKQILKDHNVPDWYIGSCEKIKYMFPKAHAAAYVINSIRVAWFKVHHPLNYYRVYLSIRRSDYDIETMVKGRSSVLALMDELDSKGFDVSNKEEGVYGTLQVVNEMMARGFKFDNISLTESDATMFKINKDKTGLIPPFTTLDGMGDTAAKKIVEERNNRPYVSIEDLQNRGKVSQTMIDKLRGMGVLDGLPESSQLSLDLFGNM